MKIPFQWIITPPRADFPATLYRLAVAPLADERAGLSATPLASAFDAMSRVDREYLAFGSVLLATVIAGWAYELAGGTTSGRLRENIAPLLFAAGLFFVLNTALVTLAIAIERRESIFAVWKRVVPLDRGLVLQRRHARRAPPSRPRASRPVEPRPRDPAGLAPGRVLQVAPGAPRGAAAPGRGGGGAQRRARAEGRRPDPGAGVSARAARAGERATKSAMSNAVNVAIF